MKDLQQIISQQPVYLNDWAESGKFGVVADFAGIHISKKEYEATEAPYSNERYWLDSKAAMKSALAVWDSVNILFASYGCANYSGDAFVLIEKDGKLLEVNAGHCSCFGLEGQFAPEETTPEVLAHRLTVGRMGADNYAGNEFAKELKEFLGVLPVTV